MQISKHLPVSTESISLMMIQLAHKNLENDRFRGTCYFCMFLFSLFSRSPWWLPSGISQAIGSSKKESICNLSILVFPNQWIFWYLFRCLELKSFFLWNSWLNKNVNTCWWRICHVPGTWQRNNAGPLSCVPKRAIYCHGAFLITDWNLYSDLRLSLFRKYYLCDTR